MITAQFYDLNVWSRDDGKLCLTAYEWEATPDGQDLQTNNNKFHTIEFTAPQHMREIEYLLNDLYVNHYPLTDYDTWVDLDELVKDDIPESIEVFLKTLPDYKIPAIAL